MNPCCPNEVASICTECASATVAGATISLPLLLAGIIIAGVAGIILNRLSSRLAEERGGMVAAVAT